MLETRRLGRTGMHVSQLCLGTMMFGAWGEKDHDRSIAVIRRALESGIQFIDTADAYGMGESETIVGKALVGRRRDDVILATKFHWPMDVPMGQAGGDPNKRGNSRRWIMRAVERSLGRLGTDYIDLYQAHRPDPDTDIEETLSALTDLQQQGKIRAFGTSTFPAQQLVQAQWCSEKRGLRRFSTEQPAYSMLARHAEADVLPIAEEYDLGVLTWGPLAGGWLSGKYRTGTPSPGSKRADRLPHRYDLELPENRAKLAVVEALHDLADEAGVTLIEMSLAFVLRHPAVTSAIIGPRTIEHLESQLSATDVSLTDDVLDRIDEIVAPGSTLTDVDRGYRAPVLAQPWRRRRSR
jgi:aryl-alcohol dehydrogenase-like predicted oxidoreductase